MNNNEVNNDNSYENIEKKEKDREIENNKIKHLSLEPVDDEEILDEEDEILDDEEILDEEDEILDEEEILDDDEEYWKMKKKY